MRTLLVAMLAVVLAAPALADAPVAVASATPAAVQSGDVVTLSGSSSSTVNGTFLWTQVQGPAVAIVGASEVDATVTCAAPGTYSFELTVVDAGGSSSDTVLFTVGGPDSAAPMAVTFTVEATRVGAGWVSPAGPRVVNQGDSITFNFSPNMGNQVSTVAVDGGAAVDYSALTYTFTDVQANHTLAVTFEAIPPPPAKSGGGGGGGGGGCSMVAAGNVNALGWALPYASLALYWLAMRRPFGSLRSLRASDPRQLRVLGRQEDV